MHLLLCSGEISFYYLLGIIIPHLSSSGTGFDVVFTTFLETRKVREFNINMLMLVQRLFVKMLVQMLFVQMLVQRLFVSLDLVSK